MMKLKIRLDFTQILILAVLFLGFMNVGNLYFYIVFFAFILCLAFNYRRVKFDNLFLILLFFSFSYLIFHSKSRDSITTIFKQFSFPICYFMGLNFVKQGKSPIERIDDAEHRTSRAMSTLALGTFAHFLLNMIINIDSLSRNNVDIWTGEIVTATGQACLAVMAAGLFSALLFSESKKYIKISSFVGMALIFIYNLVLAGRTLILLLVVVLGVSFFFTVKKSGVIRKRKVVFFSFLVIVSLLIVYIQNLFGVRDWILDSNLSARFDKVLFSEDTRMYLRYAYLMNMWKYPLGGGALRSAIGGYSHDLYLDVYSDTGVIGFLLLLIFVVASVFNALKVIRSSDYTHQFKLLVLCMYLVILMEFFLEPIIQGVPWLFCAFCFFSGLIKSLPGRTIGTGKTA